MTFQERFEYISNKDINKIEQAMLDIAKSKNFETLNYVKGALFGFSVGGSIFSSKRFKRKFLEELYIRIGMEEINY